jgi:tetratricopeptide (TPR) repeat protein
LQQGKIKQAQAAFTQAIKINPKYPDAHYNLGVISFNQGKLPEALASFRKSAEANPNYPHAYYGAGLVFMQLKQHGEAAKVFNYAKNLYNSQGNPQWASKAEQLLQQAQKLHQQ